MPRKILIMGAAGKDFHVFNTCYRDQPDFQIVAFTATQIPHIDGRVYPPELAGSLYPKGVPIHPETELCDLIRHHGVDEVVFSYSDVSYEYLAGREKLVREAGAEFSTFDVDRTMLPSSKPVIAVTAVRTGCGKSQTTRYLLKLLAARGKRAVAVRHPMPYGNLVKQRCQRFAELEDLARHECTIEEMEEYEPIISAGFVVYAGVDYGEILRQAEQEADVVLWDGGNNDTPFYKPDLWIVVADPLRPGHELGYFPGRVNFERADTVVINKIDRARPEDVESILANLSEHNPGARVVKCESEINVDEPDRIRGKRVLVVEDGPTLTHGGMTFGAGVVAAERLGMAELVDPRPYVVGEIAATFETYPGIGTLLPAMGYGARQVADLEATIARVPADSVVIATPVDLRRIIKIDKPTARVTYELVEKEGERLDDLVGAAIEAGHKV